MSCPSLSFPRRPQARKQKESPQIDLFPVRHALKRGDEVALAVGDLDRIGADLAAQRYFFGPGDQDAAGNRLEILNVDIDGHGHRAVRIARGREGQVRQRKNHSPVHGAHAVEVVRLDGQSRFGVAAAGLDQLDAAILGEGVFVEKGFFVRHRRYSFPRSPRIRALIPPRIAIIAS